MSERVPTPEEFEAAQAANKELQDAKFATLVSVISELVQDDEDVVTLVAQVVAGTIGYVPSSTEIDEDEKYWDTYTLVLVKALNTVAGNLFYPSVHPSVSYKG